VAENTPHSGSPREPLAGDSAPASAAQGQSDQNATSAEASAADSLAAQLQTAIAERDANLDKWLRAQADLDNYRKRILKEMEQDRIYGILPLVRDLLPALDNLHRAVEAAQKTPDAAQLIQGVQMVVKQFDDILGKHGAQPINAVDQPFDPNLHQAIQQVPTADKPPMTVLAEFERGYTLKERVVRPSAVVVSAAPES